MNENDEFIQWLRAIGEGARKEATGKAFMLNPVAMKKLERLYRFFKRKSDESVKSDIEAGIEPIPYQIELMQLEPWMQLAIFKVIVPTDFNLGENDCDEFAELVKEVGGTSIGALNDAISILFNIDNYTVLIK